MSTIAPPTPEPKTTTQSRWKFGLPELAKQQRYHGRHRRGRVAQSQSAPSATRDTARTTGSGTD